MNNQTGDTKHPPLRTGIDANNSIPHAEKLQGIHCKWCDFKNAVRYGRCDYRCPRCNRQLMLDMVLMSDAGIDYSDMEGEL